MDGDVLLEMHGKYESNALLKMCVLYVQNFWGVKLVWNGAKFWKILQKKAPQSAKFGKEMDLFRYQTAWFAIPFVGTSITQFAN